jgi:ADP-heptose:LPS heptosyltransferase
VRVLASNPDTIGDLVLRQPLYRALLDAGHELVLVVRPLLEPLLSAIAPGARVIRCALNLYDPRLEPDSPALAGLSEAAAALDPDLLLVAPFQWTALDERLAADLTRARVVAMTGRRFFDHNFGPQPPSSLRVTDPVRAAEDAPELRKNELLAAAALGRAVKLPDPALEAAPEHIQAAQAVLSRLGLVAGGYWAACVGDSEWTRIRNWQPERWGQVLGEWAARHGRRFLLIGHESEAAATEQVRRAMGDASSQAVAWCGRGDGDLDVLMGLLASSAGYIGRDTGPMHLAAAMGKPVIAVFGGGTWPRFIPAAGRGAALTVGVPCAGCNWVCHLPESYCIKEVPAAEVLAAVEAVESGRAEGMQARALKPPELLTVRIAREGAAASRANTAAAAAYRRVSMEQTQTLERAMKEAAKAELLARELDDTRAEMARRETLLKQRVAATENAYRTRHDQFDAELRRARDAAEAEYRQRLAAAESEHHRRESELRAALARAQAELAAAHQQTADLRLKLQGSHQQQQQLQALVSQQSQEIDMLRSRVRDLVISRWRRYGQKAHLCMTLPWEKDYANGSH